MTDLQVKQLIASERKRQSQTLQMIPSENYTSKQVREALGSAFVNKYAEGYPHKRYYQGNEFNDELEILCQERAKKLFNVPFVNVQPLSGAVANIAITKALMTNKEDVQLSQLLSSGGHLSMGQEVHLTSDMAKSEHYLLDKTGEVDWSELWRLARIHKPKIIWSGGTGYTKIFDWKKYREIADDVGAYFVADISHIGGLVAGGAHPSPVNYADVVMTTTHKTLRGPRGAMIMVTTRGLKHDPDLPSKIDKAIFPGVQGGPHMNQVSALAVALKEASTPSFAKYSQRIVENAKVLASELQVFGFKLVGDGTENHMLWIDLSNWRIDGWMAAWGLEEAGIITNRQAIINDPKTPYYPSGLRLGTPAITTLGMRAPQVREIAGFVTEVIEHLAAQKKWQIKDWDQAQRKQFKVEIRKDATLHGIARRVRALCSRFRPHEFV